MKFKKIAAVMAAAVMVMSFAAGCGSSDEGSKDGGNSAGGANISVISREEGSGTRGAFVELFGVEEEVDGEKVDQTTTDATVTNNTSVMLTTVSGDENAIGYVSLGSLNDDVKAVKIDGAEATADNIKNGSYKVSRPFNIVTKDGVSEEAQDFINFILSKQGQEVVTEEGYIPLDTATEYAASGVSGKVAVSGSSSVSPVMEKLAEAYQALNPDADIQIQTSDSTTGVTDAINGTSDIGMASRELKDSETSQGAVGTVIATDGIAVIVNNANSVDDLTVDQVKGIFTGKTLTWDEVTK
ncbi:substrate-binding domain-containing protein [Sellimonas sp.]|uniref:substrate-binding domain-containing protein n=1 Tax=Sellimonas sp. TaxID=2021466 RepID=UPI000B38CA81|nr:substrate-binding domain-containing protein [Sellimonas sp.]OUP65244.1 phosphate ABC transporter substrate-binding protein [Drancourtella sp. An177]